MRPSVLFVALAVLLGAPAFASGANVGFQEIEIPNGAEPPLDGGVWYPTQAAAAEHGLGPFRQVVSPGAPVDGRGLPLVVISHGGGGSFASHFDTALALAHAGFVVAAVSHAGDTFDDQSQVLKLWRRPAQLRRLVSYMLEAWPRHGRLDSARVGAFGFSNGGFTVLVSAGGIPDLSTIGPYCLAHPSHDLCQTLKRAGVERQPGGDVPAGAWISDPRIKAIVVAAPAFGFAFSRAGLRDVHIPVQLWRAEKDRHQPNPWYDEAVRAALPHAPEYHLVHGAGHYDFLPPCSPSLAATAPAICADPPDFDRATFHRMFNAEIVRFFRANLPSGAGCQILAGKPINLPERRSRPLRGVREGRQGIRLLNQSQRLETRDALGPDREMVVADDLQHPARLDERIC